MKKWITILLSAALVFSLAACGRTPGGSGQVEESMKKYGRMYPNAGYGGRFGTWVFSDDREPYNSYGNGSAMRVSDGLRILRSDGNVAV